MRSQAVSFKKSRGFPCLNKICDNQNIFDIKKSVLICDNLWVKKVGGREMLKANGGNVKSFGIGEKS